MQKAVLRILVGALSAGSCFACVNTAAAQESLIDEVRLGVSGSMQSGDNFEPGVFPSATLFFDPLGANSATGFTETLLRPRFHVGTIVSTAGNTSQLKAGFTWTVDLSDKFFLDLGFGGALNNGNLDKPNDGPQLGCHLMFNESLAVGYKITQNWRVLATAEHSSNANLCDENDGLSYAGIAVGYKF